MLNALQLSSNLLSKLVDGCCAVEKGRMEKEEKTGERGDLCAVNNAALLQNMSLL